MTVNIVLGQGIAGSVLAWSLHWKGHKVHLVDRNDECSASHIAAGLITPFTGRRISRAHDFDTSLSFAATFYRRVEAETGCSVFEQTPAIRLFENDSERAQFLTERADQHREEIRLLTDLAGQTVGFEMLHAARLHVREFLTVTRHYFTAFGQYHQANVDLVHDVELTPDAVKLSTPAIQGARLFFCQGYQTTPNPWFPGVPDAPARGEILTLRILLRHEQRVTHRVAWLAPWNQQNNAQPAEYVLGATYDREDLTSSTTEAGRSELLTALRAISDEDFTVTGHFSAVRSSTRNRQPVAEIHQEYPQLAILNGMGSKASVLAPITAHRLLEKIEQLSQTREVPDSVERPKKPVSLTKLAHTIVQRAIREGDTVIDATAGNGHDTSFLSKCTGERGRVISVDTQPQAIAATATRLGLEQRTNVEQLLASHSVVLSRLVSEGVRVRVIMFNLGYLPGGDKQQTTQPDTTVEALKSGARLLDSGGVMTVIAYRGHAGGRHEAEAVQRCLQQIEALSGTLDVIPGSSEHADSPILFVYRS